MSDSSVLFRRTNVSKAGRCLQNAQEARVSTEAGSQFQVHSAWSPQALSVSSTPNP
jgi:hypothetical protein